MKDSFDIEGLDKLIKLIKGKSPVARVGILGAKNARAPEDLFGGKTTMTFNEVANFQTKRPKKGRVPTNAEVGAAHEFGVPERGFPIRSFLRVPISDHLQKRLESSGAFNELALKEVMRLKSFVPWVKKMALIAEGIVLDAFDTTGFGQWKQSDMTHKKVKQTLVETQQLRNAITSDVVTRT